jgi:DNA-directed RNA polymerase specialized sigma24 family protein
VDVERAVDQVIDGLNDTHRQAVQLYVFEDLPADEVGRRLALSEANVHQVASRFRSAVRELLDDGDTRGER